MTIDVDSEFLEICNNIIRENKGEKEWEEIESCDMFQTDNYNGGFDATEMEFTFSYFGIEGKEYWFQVSLSEVTAISQGNLKTLKARKAER